MSSSLFVVPRQVQQSDPAPEAESEPLEVTGNAQTDIETALRAIAFLVEFVQIADPAELRHCVDVLTERRGRQR